MQEPRMIQKEYDRKIDAIKVCGTNRGPHDYIPIAWVKKEDKEHVTHLMCRVCFTSVNMQTLHENFPMIRM